MKIFTFSFKSLLIAAGLMLGSANAWADATVTLTSSYAVDNYAKSFYINFKDKTIDDGSTYSDVVAVGSCVQRTGYGVQYQNNGSGSFTVSKSISKGDLLILQVGQTGTAGISVSVGSTVSNPIKNDGYLAFYATADAASFSVTLNKLNYIAAMQVLSPSNTTYVVNAVTSNGTLLKQIATGEFSAEGTIYYPYGVMKDGVCYVKAKNGDEPYWGFTNVAAGLRTIVYTSNDWAYYSEMEDMNNASLGGTRYSLPGRASYGGWKWMNKNARMYSSNLSAGTYSITLYGRNSKGNEQVPPVVIIRFPNGTYSSTVATFVNWSASNTAEYTVNNVVIPEGCAFCLYQKDYTSNIDLDYVYAVKTSSSATISATIGSTGWTTFASAYPLNLSSMSASTGDVEAFYASAIGDGNVTLTSTDKSDVAVGQGIMLKGTAGATITIPVVASGTSISGNKLVGCTTSTPLSANANYYVLVNNGGTADFQSLEDNGATIPAGKAYLDATAGGGAKILRVVIDGQASEVVAPEVAKTEEEEILFNMAGIQVDKNFKGFVVNQKGVKRFNR